MNIHYVIAQINPIVGDIEHNTRLVLDAVQPYARDANALVIFPELCITGYPPEDLLLRKGFAEKAYAVNRYLCEQTQAYKCSVILGNIWLENGLIYNAALLLRGGEIVHIHKKNALPNYGVFDERRYFAQGSAPIVCEHRGQRLGILICEDGWMEHNWQLLKVQDATSVVVINASPFEVEKQSIRLELFKAMAKKYAIEIIYVNMAGAQDDVVFDGASFALDASGELLHQAPAFEPSLEQVKTDITPYPSRLESIWLAIGSGLKNYLQKNQIKQVIIGLSGGIDSAVVATLAADVLGAESVHAVLMPSQFTSQASNDDAAALAKALHISTSIVPLEPYMQAAEQDLIANLNRLAAREANWREDLAVGGNLQARFRGNILMAYSNALGGVVINTSNKSELAVGYSTMYGDACGAYSPLKDVYKTDVYQLADWRNTQSQVIPQAIIDKAPSAELKPGQQDNDQLPDYGVLDTILFALIEQGKSIHELVESGLDEALCRKIHAMLRGAEYKRRQFPPGPKVSSMLYGKDWRYPLTNGYHA